MSDPREVERQLNEMLTEGDIKLEDRHAQERERMSPKYEIRIQTTMDPIVEETRLYRSIAKELDGRYDEYLKKTKFNPDKTESDK
ncbi:hypothetical protein PASE110613_14865 [Paenibacillus sediminis]|uniref:Uncharacterized protein n=1 Tax=Paenibacillus sediminis TaxID=664909 RepID=A0ABS4H7G4_9BACL|nr:hypothetical protein [Paenibacillus sediminis]MBP1938005.1 hypothetical protein [Paenibacillus sediminis]